MLQMNRMQRNQQSCNNGDCKERLALLRAIDFAIQETVLYLDAYPNCAEALAYYHKLIEERRQVMEYYEQKCGPLTFYGNVSKSSWDWTDGPWPWEADAN
jgi:spore coat protein JB